MMHPTKVPTRDKAALPGNAKAGKPDGKRHRNQTAPSCQWFVFGNMGQGRNGGVEPTASLTIGAPRQAPLGAKPNSVPARMVGLWGLLLPSDRLYVSIDDFTSFPETVQGKRQFASFAAPGQQNVVLVFRSNMLFGR